MGSASANTMQLRSSLTLFRREVRSMLNSASRAFRKSAYLAQEFETSRRLNASNSSSRPAVLPSSRGLKRPQFYGSHRKSSRSWDGAADSANQCQ